MPLGLVEPFHIGFGFTYRDKAGGQRSWKLVHPRPEVLWTHKHPCFPPWSYGKVALS